MQVPTISDVIADEPFRPLKRVEYERLAQLGFFDNERVELLFGVVVPMAPLDVAHGMSCARLHRLLLQAIGDRADVWDQTSFPVSDISEPEPDLFVVPPGEYWTEHPKRAFLVVEVARSSLARDRNAKARVYGLSGIVDEYWIVNHVDGVIEVYRDREPDGNWRSLTVHGRGERLAMLAFPDVIIDVAQVLPPAA